MLLANCIRCGLRLAASPVTHPFLRLLVAKVWSSPKTDWKKAVSEAEKVVGYPTSFMSLRCLLSDEISNVALHMRKLVGTKHPLLKTARGFIYDGKHSLQARGLIVLLLSKAAGPGRESEHLDPQAMISGVYPSQRSLAEITEIIYTASLIHKGVVDLKNLQPGDGSPADMEFGNKMAILSGDFLLANAATSLGSLRNTYVVETISKAIGELMKAEFTKLRNKDGFPALPAEGVTWEDWKEQTYLSSASLLARSCQASMMLANHDEVTQQKAFTFGEHVAYAYQLHDELRPFLQLEENSDRFCVTSAPVIMYYQQHCHPVLPVDNRDRQELYQRVMKSSAITRTKQMCIDHGNQAKEALTHFDQSEARTALENIVDAVLKL